MNFDIQLDRQDVAHVIDLMSNPGFNILIEKIFRPECNKFITKLMNTPNHNEKEVISNHSAAQVVAKWFSGVVNSLNEIKLEYSGIEDPSKPIDITEGIIDLDNLNLPEDNYFEEK